MGHFSHCCKLSGLPITGGTPVALIVMKPVKDLYDNSEKSLKQYGTTYMCSNEGTRLKYTPVWFPIIGEYDDYGRIENIVEDDNTKILEAYYGLNIQQIMDIVTSGRKDDGYDDALKVIKKPIQRPKDQLEGERHFEYYQRIMKDPMPCDGHYPDVSGKWEEKGYEGWTIWRDGKKIKATKEQYDADFKLIHEHYARYEKWKKVNPDVEDDYGKPEYEEKFKELLSYSGMWIHGDVYDKLTESTKNDEYNKLDFGRPEVLNALGLIEGKKTDAERYNRPFTLGKLTVMSDGNWIDGQIYTITDFKKLAESVGVGIDYSPIENKSKIEQLYDVVIPTLKNDEDDIDAKAMELIDSDDFDEEKLKELYKKKNLNGDFNVAYKDYMKFLLRKSLGGMNREEMELYHYFLNTDKYGSERIGNPLTKLYLNVAKEGKIRDNLVRFWRFDSYMYACGRYYEVVGVSPQDGEHADVLTVLTTAKDILQADVDARNEHYDE